MAQFLVYKWSYILSSEIGEIVPFEILTPEGVLSLALTKLG